MSDPRYTDPRLSEPPLQEETRLERVEELERSSNAMWGWIAGGVVLALLLVFVFTSGPGTDTASTNMPPDRPTATTGMSPPAGVPTPAETTGQGSPRPAPAPATPPAGAQ